MYFFIQFLCTDDSYASRYEAYLVKTKSKAAKHFMRYNRFSFLAITWSILVRLASNFVQHQLYTLRTFSFFMVSQCIASFIWYRRFLAACHCRRRPDFDDFSLFASALRYEGGQVARTLFNRSCTQKIEVILPKISSRLDYN